MFDLQVEELKQEIVNKINQSQLPATALVYVLKEILQVAISTMNNQIAIQKMQKQSNENKETE